MNPRDPPLVGAARDDVCVVDVHAVDRDQALLLPSLSEWLPEDHLASFVVDVVAKLDLSGPYVSLRPDGRGAVFLLLSR